MQPKPDTLSNIALALLLPIAGLAANACAPGSDAEIIDAEQSVQDAARQPDSANFDNGQTPADAAFTDATNPPQDAARQDSTMPDANHADTAQTDTNHADAAIDDIATTDSTQNPDSGAPIPTSPVFYDAPLPTTG